MVTRGICRSLWLVSAAVVMLGCTEEVPEYCDESKPCPEGQFCNLERNACEPKLDSGTQDTVPVTDTQLDKKTGSDILGSDGPPLDTVGLDVVTPPGCGDKTKGSDEECDDQDFGGATCTSMGFDCGELACTGQCKIDTSACKKGWAQYVTVPVESLTTDPAGNTYFFGQQSGTKTIGQTTLSSSNIYAAKLDHKGSHVWAIEPAGDSFHLGGIAADAAGNAYITGTYGGSITFGLKTLNFEGDCGDEIYVAKILPGGTWDWAVKAGGPSSHCDTTDAIAVTSTGEVIIAGSFDGTTKFGTHTLTSQVQDRDAFVAKLDSTGKFVWVTPLDGGQKENVKGMAVDAAGNIYVVGEGESIYGCTYGSYEIFVVKVKATGAVAWKKCLGGAGYDQAVKIAVDQNGNSYVTGALAAGNAYCSPIGPQSFAGGAFLAKLDANGGCQWIKESDSTAVGASGSQPYLVGGFSGSKTFGTVTLSSKGGTDVFIAKIKTSDGSYLSATSAGGTGDDKGALTVVDHRGDPVVFGSFKPSATFGTTTLTTTDKFLWNAACFW